MLKCTLHAAKLKASSLKNWKWFKTPGTILSDPSVISNYDMPVGVNEAITT